MGKKRQYKKFRKEIDSLQIITRKQLVKESLDPKLIKRLSEDPLITDKNGLKFDTNKAYSRLVKKDIPINHLKHLKKLYHDKGMDKVNNYIKILKKVDEPNQNKPA